MAYKFNYTPLSAAQVIKFSILVGITSIFIDAIIAHGIFWDNDPYWTYWITKSFLITAVFSIGTAFMGIGFIPAFMITFMHTIILEIYYTWFAPVGLPQEPEWLDFNHVWVTGFPVHYLAILTGYFISLWLWQRNHLCMQEHKKKWHTIDARYIAFFALVATVFTLVCEGIITQAILLHSFPGITFFIQHALISIVFLFIWSVYGGLDRIGWLIGSLFLSLTWTAYNMYLGPRGLPFTEPVYLNYFKLWYFSFPGDFGAAVLGIGLAKKYTHSLWRIWYPQSIYLGITLCAFFTSCFLSGIANNTIEGLVAEAATEGSGFMIIGDNPTNMMSRKPIQGSIYIKTIETGNRWSPMQNTDQVYVQAQFSSDSDTYIVNVRRAMPRHPHNKYTTWSGVVYRHQMHGNTGIGTSSLPRLKPDIALWGWGEVIKNGQRISAMAATHVMVMSHGTMQGIMLEVETEDKGLLNTPDGYLTVMWPTLTFLQFPEQAIKMRQLLGWIILLTLAILFAILARISMKKRCSSSFTP